MLGVSWFDYWAFLGLVYLIILSVQDLIKMKGKKQLQVDARYNYILVGLTISLFSHLEHFNIWFVVGLIICIMFFNWVLLKVNKFQIKRDAKRGVNNSIGVFGRADIVAFNWIYLGFGIISYPLILMFFLFLLFYGSVTMVFARKIVKLKRIPFFPVITAAFISVLLLMSIGGY